MITKDNVKRQFQTSDVYQYQSKQLFLVHSNLLVSYRTIIGKSKYNPETGKHEWFLVTTKHSPTTTKHSNWFKREHERMGYKVFLVDQLPE